MAAYDEAVFEFPRVEDEVDKLLGADDASSDEASLTLASLIRAASGGGKRVYPVEGASLEGRTLVYYDLETTGLRNPRQILQIGATCAIDGQQTTLSNYVTPRGRIEPGAAERTGLTSHDGKLYMRTVNGETKEVKGKKIVETVEIKEALGTFVKWLKKVKLGNKKVLLVGHNISSYDNQILREEAEHARMKAALNDCIYGYIDTLHLFKRERRGLGRGNYRQSKLVEHYVPEHEYRHKSVADTKTLKKLVEREFPDHLLTPDQTVLNKYIRRTERFCDE